MKANPTPLTRIYSDLFEQHQVQVWIKHDYMRHPEVQGNKWHKLKYNLKQAIDNKKNTLLTFGGAYSNHIAAVSAAAKSMNLHSIGIIRGDELAANQERWSHTLKQAHQNQMQLNFISRQDYRLKSNDEYLQQLQTEYPHAYILPEGGSNKLAVLGFAELMQEINQQLPQWSRLFSAVGTGGTLAGLTAFAYSGIVEPVTSVKKVIGIPVLKQGEYLIPAIQNWITDISNNQPQTADWELLTQYHHGGYAKQTDDLINFQAEFETQHHVPLDPIYTSKTFYAFYDQLQSGNIPENSRVILYHSGGLQGIKT